MTSSTRFLLVFLYWMTLTNGFIPNPYRSSHLSTIQRHATQSSYTEQPALLSELEVNDAFFVLAMIPDDDDRRKTFRSYVRNAIAREEETNRLQDKWNRSNSSFVKELKKSMTMIGNAIQEDAWDHYVTSGFQPLAENPPLLWACIDMTVQLQKIIREYEQESNNKYQ